DLRVRPGAGDAVQEEGVTLEEEEAEEAAAVGTRRARRGDRALVTGLARTGRHRRRGPVRVSPVRALLPRRARPRSRARRRGPPALRDRAGWLRAPRSRRRVRLARPPRDRLCRSDVFRAALPSPGARPRPRPVPPRVRRGLIAAPRCPERARSGRAIARGTTDSDAVRLR